MSKLTRRQLIKYGFFSGSILGLDWSIRKFGIWEKAVAQNASINVFPLTQASGKIGKYIDQLAIPQVIDLTGGGSLSLKINAGRHQFSSQLPVTAPSNVNTTWGYGDSAYLGPTIEAKSGNTVNITFKNKLGSHPLANSIDTSIHGAKDSDKNTPRTSVHHDGGATRPEFDGHPEDTFNPGNSNTYTYQENGQRASGLWYHDHAIGITRLNVYAGLAGHFLLRDDFDTGKLDNPLGLPAGEFEIPLLIQDKSFNLDGSLFYPPAPAVPEFFGDVAVVNGVASPNLNVKAGLYRFRILNGSGARFYNLSLSQGKFMQIGTDGGLLNAPVKVEPLLLAPGERADVLIDFSTLKAGTTIRMTNNAVAPYPNGPRKVRKGGQPLKQIMQFTVTDGTGFRGNIPQTLRGGSGQPPTIATLSKPSVTRNLLLMEILSPTTGSPVMLLLNNLMWENDSSIEKPQQGSVEQWNIINTTPDTHPIHLHLVDFQIKERQGFDSAAYLAKFYPDQSPNITGKGPYPAPEADSFAKGRANKPDDNELGWKDTIRANPGDITRILVRFPTQAELGFNPDAPFTNPIGGTAIQGYVWHCHILEHEDNEMMLRYRLLG